jgi:hypothetical protein
MATYSLSRHGFEKKMFALIHKSETALFSIQETKEFGYLSLYLKLNTP